VDPPTFAEAIGGEHIPLEQLIVERMADKKQIAALEAKLAELEDKGHFRQAQLDDERNENSILKARCEELKQSHDTLLTFTVGPLQLENAAATMKLRAVREALEDPVHRYGYGEISTHQLYQATLAAMGALESANPPRNIGQEILEGVRELNREQTRVLRGVKEDGEPDAPRQKPELKEEP
jgi:hypothetical protein